MPVEARDTMPVQSADDVVKVRQAVRARAIAAGFSLVDQTKIVTAASEIARNTVDYGGGGTLCLELVREGARRGVRLTFADQGPGIADLEQAMTDGYTSGGGLGAGTQRRQTVVQRIPGEIRARSGHHRHLGALAVTWTRASSIPARSAKDAGSRSNLRAGPGLTTASSPASPSSPPRWRRT